MDIRDYLEQYNIGRIQGTNYNQYASRPTYYSFNEVDIRQFNEIYQTLYNSDLNIIKRTKSGAIRKGLRYRSNNYSWDIRIRKTGAVITALVDGKIFAFNIGTLKDKEDVEAPWKCWKTFVDLCNKNNIDINSYVIDNGLEVKKEIESPLIKMNTRDEILENVNHIDFHNSYPSGLVITHPEFKPVIEELYTKRKDNPKYKFVLNCTIGCMQSDKPNWKARWAHLAKDAIKNNNDRVKKLAFQLQITGHRILGFNTDGIWYQGPVYHGDGEGPNLCQWSNDHTNCRFRAKSDGAYEFIENGEYHPVVRGQTRYDIIKPRDQWSWGDIYRNDCSEIKVKFKEGEGVIYEE